jgi:hypothetical protein
MMTKCERCDDTRCVCEAHDTVPWRDCECGAPGMPCPDCNASDPPGPFPGFRVTVDDKGPRN